MTSKTIEEKKAVLEVLERVFSTLEAEYKDVTETYDYRITDEQKVDRDGNLVFDDEGNPVFKKEWYDRPRTDEEMTDWYRAKAKAVDTVRKHLEKLI